METVLTFPYLNSGLNVRQGGGFHVNTSYTCQSMIGWCFTALGSEVTWPDLVFFLYKLNPQQTSSSFTIQNQIFSISLLISTYDQRFVSGFLLDSFDHNWLSLLRIWFRLFHVKSFSFADRSLVSVIRVRLILRSKRVLRFIPKPLILRSNVIESFEFWL